MNILFTSCGRRSYLIEYFKQALNGLGKVYASNNQLTPTLLKADGYVISPNVYDDNYIDFLINYCHKNDIGVIISLFDIDLPVLAKNEKIFKDNNIFVLVSNLEFINICNDKYKTYEFFIKNNIPTMKTYISINDVLDALNKKEITYPVVIKPRFGMGSIGVYIAENQIELEVFYNKCLNKIKSTYLQYESLDFLNSCILFQEFISGTEYGLDIINDLNCNYKNTVCKEKIAMRAGETDIAKTVFSKVLKDYGEKIAHLSKHIGNLDCDVLISNNNVYFLEMNCRFGGGYPFSHAANINLPLAIIKWLNKENADIYVCNEKIGVKSYKELGIYTLAMEKNNERN